MGYLEGDWHDVIDVDSGDDDDDFYGGGNSDAPMSSMDSDEDYRFNSDSALDYDFISNDSDDLLHSQQSQKNYTILKEEDIRCRQEDDITKVSTVLSVSREVASLLLRRYNWTVSTVHEEWFSDEERVRKAIGLLEKPIVQFSADEDVTCGICFDSYSFCEIRAAACGHKKEHLMRLRGGGKWPGNLWSLERYTHYYERWAANQKSRLKALTGLAKLVDETEFTIH